MVDNTLFQVILERLNTISDNTSAINSRLSAVEAVFHGLPERVEALEEKRNWLAGVGAALSAISGFYFGHKH